MPTFKPSKAFQLHVNEQFIKQFMPYLDDNFGIKDYDEINDMNAEDLLISAMSIYYCDLITEKIDFYKIKSDYIHNLKNLSPNLDYVQAKKIIDREQNKLETYARIKFNVDEPQDSYSLDILVYLYIIHSKLNKKSIEDIKKSKVYRYLKLAYIEQSLINMDNIITNSLSELSKGLQESVETLWFDAKSKHISSLDNDGNLLLYSFDGEITNKIPLSNEDIEQYRFISNNPYKLDVFIGEKLFKQKLHDEMRIQDNGMIF